MYEYDLLELNWPWTDKSKKKFKKDLNDKALEGWRLVAISHDYAILERLIPTP